MQSKFLLIKNFIFTYSYLISGEFFFFFGGGGGVGLFSTCQLWALCKHTTSFLYQDFVLALTQGIVYILYLPTLTSHCVQGKK